MALVGHSGSGKTTLVEALAPRPGPRGVAGHASMPAQLADRVRAQDG
ncbi:hypothetical protein [Streptomyces sp. A1277]|nr:hypothetical protein [Streptomyces sp. A1277]